jgi:DNA-directed RNA polymerase specialized sigma24 family protein
VLDRRASPARAPSRHCAANCRTRTKLRPWLYAIARNEALRQLRGRTREQLRDAPPDAAAGEPQPEVLAARNELAAVIRTRRPEAFRTATAP